jgi:hypothetical protein
VEPLFQEKSGLASFGAKVASSLNGMDLSFMKSVAGFYLLSQVAQIFYMIEQLFLQNIIERHGHIYFHQTL